MIVNVSNVESEMQVVCLENHGSTFRLRLPTAGEEQLPELFARLTKEPTEIHLQCDGWWVRSHPKSLDS